MTRRLIVGALLGALLCVGLGVWVTHHPLAPIDRTSAVRGTNVPLAIALTTPGYAPVLSCLGIGSLIVAALLRAPLRLPIAICISQLVSAATVDAVKVAFGRARPAVWYFRHEPGHSFPSGHATTAIVFYGAWLVVLAFAPLPFAVRIAGTGVLAGWIVGIGWSRVALGAHYPTDVIGGYLFGASWLCASIALKLRIDGSTR